MTLDLTVTDLFCGAGGSSQGAVAAGASLVMAANHWQLAVETHATNFPAARHDCADVSQVDPRRYPTSDILLASPECTHHSQARTVKHIANLFDPEGHPTAERSRATMWDVPRFAEQHRYQAIVVENVVEVLRWPPFTAWISAMESYGYAHRLVSLNSMIAQPTPQSRDRLYVVFWRRENRTPDLDFSPASWCPSCEAIVEGRQAFKRPDRVAGKYRSQYVYRCPSCRCEVAPMVSPALNAIDWTLPCPRIGDRKKALADATLRRIAVGLERFCRPVVAQSAGHTYERPGYARVWPVDEPLKAQTATLQHGVALPAWMVPLSRGNDDRKGPRSLDLPWPGQTGRAEWGFVMVNRSHNLPRSFLDPFAAFCTADHQGVVLPFLSVLRSGRPRNIGIDEPLATVVADGGAHFLVEPFLAELRGGSSDVRCAATPMSTVTASGNHHGVVVPFYVKGYGTGNDASMLKPVSLPLGAVTTQDHHGVVTVPFLTPYHAEASPRSVTEPMPTQDTTARFGLVTPMPAIEDCGFRMLEPHEIQAAMAFESDYTILGSKRQKVRQLGNAVTPPAMSMIVRRVIESLS